MYRLVYFAENDDIHYVGYFSSANKAKKWKNDICSKGEIFKTNEFLFDCTDPSGPTAPEFGFFLTGTQFGNCDWDVGRDEKRDNNNYFLLDSKTYYIYRAMFINKNIKYKNEDENVGVYANKIDAINGAAEHLKYFIKKYKISTKELGTIYEKISYQSFIFEVDIKMPVRDFEKNQIIINECHYYQKYSEDITDDVLNVIKDLR